MFSPEQQLSCNWQVCLSTRHGIQTFSFARGVANGHVLIGGH